MHVKETWLMTIAGLIQAEATQSNLLKSSLFETHKDSEQTTEVEESNRIDIRNKKTTNWRNEGNVKQEKKE
jgi:hypothetical protein